MKMLTTKEVAALLGVKKCTVLSLVQRGVLPCVRLGKRVMRYDEAAIRAKLEINKEVK